MQNKAFSMEDLFAFLNAGVSAFHSTAAAAAILEAEGYRNCPESAAWHLVPGGKYYTTRNGSAILAWRMPKGPLTGWHAAASHSDSPTWRIKTLDGADHGFARAEVEGYGGMLMSTWFDRPLSVAGRLLVRTADGVESRLVHPERALACIPNLCIHFNREANTGLNYNPQVDLQPIFGAEGGSLKDTLAAEAGGKAEDILATDLVLCITEKAQRVGLQGEYFMSGRIDDLECAYATLYGFLQGRGEEAGRGDIWVMFDNEEVGSSSRQGAQGSLMSDVLARIEESLGVTKEQSIRARTNCLLLSADNGHAIHPNHPEKSDQKRHPQVQCPPDLHHQRPDRCRLYRHLRKGRGAGADLCQPCRCGGRQHPGQPAGPPDPDAHGGYWRGPAGHALGDGNGQLQGCGVSGQCLRCLLQHPHLPAGGRAVEAGPVSGAVVGRFAPSPSGRLHLGNLACSLLAWLSAKSQGGRIVLRIEDLDAERCPRIYADLLEQDLAWLGLVWDEGGSTGGPHGPYYQSECADIYTGQYKKLEAQGLVYPCFCSRAQLHAASAPHTSDGNVIYPGTCRDLTAAQIAEKRKKKAPAYRVRVPDEEITFLDGCMGPHTENLLRDCGDFYLRRADGMFAYQLAVVVDDARMGVTEVVRGSDLLSSTARQLYLYRLLGLQAPTFAHCPLLLAPDGRRLSKRDGDQSLENLREKYTAQEIVGKLAYAYGLQPEPAPCTPESLIPGFSWAKVPKQDVCLPEGLF